MPRDPSSQDDKLEVHPWWNHVPIEKRRTLRSQSRWRSIRILFAKRHSLIAITSCFYLVCALLPILVGAQALSLLALVPFLLLPALFGLIWWLTWKEYHD
jgi:hypothetical protein